MSKAIVIPERPPMASPTSSMSPVMAARRTVVLMAFMVRTYAVDASAASGLFPGGGEAAVGAHPRSELGEQARRARRGHRHRGRDALRPALLALVLHVRGGPPRPA